jgi:hypothetical protein
VALKEMEITWKFESPQYKRKYRVSDLGKFNLR